MRAPNGRRLLLPGIILVVLFGAGCSAHQEITINERGSGTIELDIRLDPVFTAYLTDVTVGLGADPGLSLFNTEMVVAEFAQRPGMELLSIESPSRDRLLLELGFSSVEDILAMEGQSLTRFLRFERTEGFRRIAAEIDRRAVEHFTALGGIDPMVVESLLPPVPGMSARDYQDHLAWALEEYADERPLDLVFRDSVVVTDLVTDGDLVRMSGGVMADGHVRFSTPLIEAVTRTTPLRYSLIFTP